MKIPFTPRWGMAVLAAAGAGLLWLELHGHHVNVTGLLEVVGGTLCATALGRSPRALLGLLRDLPSRLRETVPDRRGDVERFLHIAGLHREGSVLGAERSVKLLTDPLLRAGAQLVIDRIAREDLVRLLQWKSGALREQDHAEIQVLRTMMMLAPAFGMLGTLLGMVRMLYGLDQGGLPQVGTAMGFALWSTVYGLLFANLLIKPVVMRLEQQARQRRAWEFACTEAVLMMHDRRHPGLIGEYLQVLTEGPRTVVAASGAPATAMAGAGMLRG